MPDKGMSHGKFGTAINCLDGRVQLPVSNWMKMQFHLDYIDMITEPGPDKIVAVTPTLLVRRMEQKLHKRLRIQYYILFKNAQRLF